MEIPSGESEPLHAASRDTAAQADTSVTVELQLEGSDKRLSLKCELGDSVRSVKERVCEVWEIPLPSLSLSYNGETLSGTAVLEQLGLEPGQTVELLGQALQPHPPESAVSAQENKKSKPSAESSIHQVFTVQVGDGKEVLVRLERQGMKKPFLGGYRHRVTGTEYHHAAVQTVPRPRPDTGIARFDRDTQTVTTRNKCQQVMMDAATQMDRTGCYIDSRRDRIVPVGMCESADDYHARILQQVIILQTHWRRWLAQRYVSSLRRERQRRLQWEREEEEKRRREREEREKREFHRRMNPKTKDDFELLYHALEVWRQDELHRINSTTSGPERKAALCALLEHEAQLIASIGQHRLAAAREGKEKSVRRFLDATAAPKRWIAYDGNVTEMNTPYTLRAQQLRDLYHSLTSSGLAADERLDLLLTLKCTVKEHDCGLTRELVSLVDREADLLVRGLNPETMAGLRKRIATLFFQYCRTPLFNPEAAKHIKVPQDPSALRSNVYYCRSCSQYLPSTDFELSTNSRIVGHCRHCQELDNEARAREDLTVYRAMLRDIRKSEEGYKDGSNIIFLVQETDLRYLIENIWGGQSALSSEKELYELRLVRWDCREQWSPWNCVLLSKEEAQAHLRLDGLEESYGAQFISRVHQRHVLAKSYFSRVAEMVEQMRSRVKELPLPRPQEHVMTARPAPPPQNTTVQS